MISDEKLKQILEKNNKISTNKLNMYFTESQEKEGSFLNYLINNKFILPLEIYNTIADYYKIKYINLKDININYDLLQLIPESIAQAQNVVIFGTEKNKLKIATLDPHDLQTIDFIKKKTNKQIEVYLTDPASIKNIIKQYHLGLEEKFAALLPDRKNLEKIKKINGKKVSGERLQKLAKDLPVIKIVDTILDYAIYEEASDIHIEPREKQINIRFRIDGILKEIMTLPFNLHPALVARIKVMSKLKLDEHRLPQDGRFKVGKKNQIAIRVSIIPVFNGEKIVLRLLDESRQFLTLEQLGLLPEHLKIMVQSIKKPNGIILVTGPTGCGKTTTLYTIINVLNSSRVNISTIEDPIEYRIDRVNQSQVNPKIGFSFANGLRTLLRQDPDIIMVGEIRDNETAEIAMHAALTGHLVLATLHTNNAVGAIPRLLEMGIPPFLVSSTVNLIIAQRLVRKICQSCIKSYNLSKEEIKEIESSFDIQDLKKVLISQNELNNENDSIESTTFYKGNGCSKCGSEGLKGRTGIYEFLEITPDISELILKKAPIRAFEEKVKEKNIISLWQDGIIKAKQGITTISEILRTTKE